MCPREWKTWGRPWNCVYHRDLLKSVYICETIYIIFKLCFNNNNNNNNGGFPGGSDSNVSACNAGDLGSLPGSARFPVEGNGNTLQCSCLENPRDGGAVCGVAQSRTRLKRLSSSSSSLFRTNFKKIIMSPLVF